MKVDSPRTRWRPPHPPPSKRIRGTELVYDADDVSPEGNLSLMLSPRDGRALDRLEKQLHVSDTAHVTGRVNFVRTLIAEVPVKNVARFVHSLPKYTRVTVDSTIQYPRLSNYPGIFASTSPAQTQSAAPPTPVPVGPVDVDRQVVGLDKVWDAGFTGKGSTVAVIDSGLYMHPDIKHAFKAFVDINGGRTEAYDNYGHGTQVAGLIAGDGTMSHGQVKGAAPGADLVGVRITTVSEAIQGIEWVIANKDKYGIRVINMSLGDTATETYKTDLWTQACEKAIRAGLVVVVAAGDEGPDAKSVDTPGDDPNVITVGALDDHKTLDRSKHEVGTVSSRGPTTPDGLTKPDILAPGIRVWGPLVPNCRLDQPEIPHIGNDYLALTGSSQAVPLVSGLICDLLEADPTLTPAQIKDILKKSAAHYLKDDENSQGAGVLDAAAALKLVLAQKASHSQSAA